MKSWLNWSKAIGVLVFLSFSSIVSSPKATKDHKLRMPVNSYSVFGSLADSRIYSFPYVIEHLKKKKYSALMWRDLTRLWSVEYPSFYQTGSEWSKVCSHDNMRSTADPARVDKICEALGCDPEESPKIDGIIQEYKDIIKTPGIGLARDTELLQVPRVAVACSRT
jgi:hypothetical protein